MKEIILPCHEIKIQLTEVDPENPNLYIEGTIESDLHIFATSIDLEASINTLEAMILACAISGIDIETPAFIEAIETVAEKILDDYSQLPPPKGGGLHCL